MTDGKTTSVEPALVKFSLTGIGLSENDPAMAEIEMKLKEKGDAL